MAVQWSANKHNLDASETRQERGIQVSYPSLVAVTDVLCCWRRARRDRSDLSKLSDVDLRDIGFPPELVGRRGLAAPSRSAKLILCLFFALLAGLTGIAAWQKTLYAAIGGDVIARGLSHAVSLVTVVGVLGTLVVAGIVKGAIGVGMPIIGFPLLTVFVSVPTAVILLTVPLVLSNIPQALEGKGMAAVLKDLLPIFIGTVPGLLVGVHFLVNVNPRYAQIIAGLALTFVVALMLWAPKLGISPRVNGSASVVVGVASGVLGGIAAVSGPVVFLFLLAKGLRGKAFTKYASTYLVISSVLLGLTLAVNRSFARSDLLISLLALPPVALGMVLGQRLRDRISTNRFKVAVLAVVLLSGLDLIRRGSRL